MRCPTSRIESLAASFSLGLLALALACNSPRKTAPAPVTAQARVYGQAFTAAAAIPVGQVLAAGPSWRGKSVTVTGQVRKACTRKGCWMELVDDLRVGGPGCRVTFKNYAFFVPTDSAGAQARVQGVVEVDTLSAAAVRHYEEEGAAFAGKRADGTAPEVRIVATGVELARAP
jgi:hypothetical protein